MKIIAGKLRSSKGFSLGELLVATLILGFMTTALAVGISASQHVYYDIVTYSEERMLLATVCDTIRSELRYAKEPSFVEVGGVKQVTQEGYYMLNTFTSANFGFHVKLISSEEKDLQIQKDTKDGKKTYPLFGSGVYSDGKLKAKLKDDMVCYDKANERYVFTAQVYQNGKASNTAEERTITVTPLDKPEIQ